MCGDGAVFFSLAAGIDALQKSLIYTIEWKNKASVNGLLVILLYDEIIEDLFGIYVIKTQISHEGVFYLRF